MGWWLQPEVWLVSQLAFWSLVFMLDNSRKANNKRKR